MAGTMRKRTVFFFEIVEAKNHQPRMGLRTGGASSTASRPHRLTNAVCRVVKIG